MFWKEWIYWPTVCKAWNVLRVNLINIYNFSKINSCTYHFLKRTVARDPSCLYELSLSSLASGYHNESPSHYRVPLKEKREINWMTVFYINDLFTSHSKKDLMLLFRVLTDLLLLFRKVLKIWQLLLCNLL